MGSVSHRSDKEELIDAAQKGKRGEPARDSDCRGGFHSDVCEARDERRRVKVFACLTCESTLRGTKAAGNAAKAAHNSQLFRPLYCVMCRTGSTRN